MKQNEDLSSYAFSHDRCAVCHYRKYRPGRRMELHHIQGRRGENPHDHRNLVMLCNECHTLFHSGSRKKSLALGAILVAKEHEDGEVDEAYLAGLRRRKAFPDLDRTIPDWAEEERAANRDQ